MAIARAVMDALARRVEVRPASAEDTAAVGALAGLVEATGAQRGDLHADLGSRSAQALPPGPVDWAQLV